MCKTMNGLTKTVDVFSKMPAHSTQNRTMEPASVTKASDGINKVIIVFHAPQTPHLDLKGPASVIADSNGVPMD